MSHRLRRRLVALLVWPAGKVIEAWYAWWPGDPWNVHDDQD